MIRCSLLALALAASGPTPAAAAPDTGGEVDLAVRLPTTLAMRQAAPPADDDEPDAAAADDDDGAPRTGGDRFLDFGSRADRADPPTLEERLTFRFNLGFGIDAGPLDCTGDVCTSPPSGITAEGFDKFYYTKLRTYGFGDAVIGTRGLGAPSLNSYFAASFRFDQSNLRSTAVPSIHDASSVDPILVRSGYVETDGFFDHPRLRPIYVRAGRQFRYGPAVAHFDGVTFGYDSRALSIGFFTGTRVSLYGFEPGLLAQRGLISGVDARFDVYELKRVPLVVSGAMLLFDDEVNFEGGLALKWSRDAVVRASMRILGDELTSQRLAIRTRLSRTTTVSAELENQSENDWPYDLLLSRSAATYTDATDTRRYLDFGFQLPRVHLALRAGTVLLDNIDVLLRLGGAFDRTADFDTGDRSGFLEAGAAFEVRLRRALGLGASVLARGFGRDDPMPFDDTTMPDELPSQIGAIGERSFIELGSSLRFEPGRKSFSTAAEVYGRVYDRQSPYIARADELEFRSGGRFSVDGWASENLRMRLEYDVAFPPTYLAPELRTIQSLRVIAEGSF